MKAKEVLEKLQNVFLSQAEEEAPATEEVKEEVALEATEEVIEEVKEEVELAEEVKEEVKEEVQAQPAYITATELSSFKDELRKEFMSMLEALMKDKEDDKEVPAHLAAQDKDVALALEEAEPVEVLQPNPESEVDKQLVNQFSAHRRMGTKDRVYKKLFG